MDSLESSELYNILADSVGLGSTDELEQILGQHAAPSCPPILTTDQSQSETDAKQRGSRGNYLCSKCKVPKKGHVCPYQPKYVRREKDKVADASVQVELDGCMTVRQLPLAEQGLPESYHTPGHLSNNMKPST